MEELVKELLFRYSAQSNFLWGYPFLQGMKILSVSFRRGYIHLKLDKFETRKNSTYEE